MNREQLLKIIEEVRAIYVNALSWANYEKAQKLKAELEEWEKRLKEGDYFP